MKQQLTTWCRGIISYLRPIHLIAAAGVVIFFWFLIMGEQGLYRLRQLHVLRESLLEARTRVSAEIEAKANEKRMLEDPKNLEMIIRKELGYIRPGEIIFQESDKDDSGADTR